MEARVSCAQPAIELSASVFLHGVTEGADSLSVFVAVHRLVPLLMCRDFVVLRVSVPSRWRRGPVANSSWIRREGVAA
jgi:hypothetical protein